MNSMSVLTFPIGMELGKLAMSDNIDSGSSTSSSGSRGSSSQSSESSSDGSDNALFSVRSTLEPDGVDDDEKKEPLESPVQDRLEGVRVEIKEIMLDRSKRHLTEMKMGRCRGYYSFASYVRELYDGDDLTEAESTDNLVHVLWPWHRYETYYIDKNHNKLDPRRLEWSKFSKMLAEIWMERRPVGSSAAGYLVVENNEAAADQLIPPDILRITFKDGNTGDIMVRDIGREIIVSLKSFIWILHNFWASWRMKEPLDPGMVTDLNMVLEQSSSLHPLYSIQCFDKSDEAIEIPLCLSMSAHELREGLETGSDDESEGDSSASGGGEGSGDDSDENEDSGDEESGMMDDKNEEGAIDGDDHDENKGFNVKRKRNERDEDEVVDDDKEEEDTGDDSEIMLSFLQSVSKVVIVRERRASS